MLIQIFSALAVIVIVIFPVWVAVHAWRKGYKTLAILIGVSNLIPIGISQVLAVITFFVAKLYNPNWDYSPNPSVYAGCGTVFYGASKRRTDGSFITTQWFTILYIPVVPIQSYRVTRLASATKNYGASITTTVNYAILEKFKLDLRQVLIVFLYLLGYIVCVSFVFGLIDKMGAAHANKSFGSDILIGFTVAYIIGAYFLLRSK
jgi:hypothetical protein